MRINAKFKTDRNAHYPIELSSTIASWHNGVLDIHDTTRWIVGERRLLAAYLGLPQESVRIQSPLVGGAFGSKGFLWMHVALTAVAAWEVGRPVKLVLTREQMFSSTGHRPRTEQEITIAADKNGVIRSTEHHTLTETSTVAHFCEPAGLSTRILYQCLPAWWYRIVWLAFVRPHRASRVPQARLPGCSHLKRASHSPHSGAQWMFSGSIVSCTQSIIHTDQISQVRAFLSISTSRRGTCGRSLRAMLIGCCGCPAHQRGGRYQNRCCRAYHRTHHADEIITGGDANLVFIAREMLREPYWALKAQQALGEDSAWPIQYGYVLKRRAK